MDALVPENIDQGLVGQELHVHQASHPSEDDSFLSNSRLVMDALGVDGEPRSKAKEQPTGNDAESSPAAMADVELSGEGPVVSALQDEDALQDESSLHPLEHPEPAASEADDPAAEEEEAEPREDEVPDALDGAIRVPLQRLQASMQQPLSETLMATKESTGNPVESFDE
jgi:hypothetical protein